MQQGGEEGPVGWFELDPMSVELALQHGELMPQHEDLNVLVAVATGQQSQHGDRGGQTDVFGPATTLAIIQTVHGGQRAVRIVTTAEKRNVAGATSRPVRVITEAGARYTASCWVRATGPLDAYVQLQEYTTAWVRDADPVKSARFTLTDPAIWYRISVTYTAARAGNLLPLTVFGSDMTAAGTALLADDCSLRRV